MWFFVTMFLCNLLMPLVMLIGGWWMRQNPPKEINALIGYRTTLSKKNKDTWAFAHDCCGRLWIKLGWILLIPSILIQLPFAHSGDDAIGWMTLALEAVQLSVLVGSISLVEKELKRTFDANGIRR